MVVLPAHDPHFGLHGYYFAHAQKKRFFFLTKSLVFSYKQTKVITIDL